MVSTLIPPFRERNWWPIPVNLTNICITQSAEGRNNPNLYAEGRNNLNAHKVYFFPEKTWMGVYVKHLKLKGMKNTEILGFYKSGICCPGRPGTGSDVTQLLLELSNVKNTERAIGNLTWKLQCPSSSSLFFLLLNVGESDLPFPPGRDHWD